MKIERGRVKSKLDGVKLCLNGARLRGNGLVNDTLESLGAYVRIYLESCISSRDLMKLISLVNELFRHGEPGTPAEEEFGKRIIGASARPAALEDG